MNFKPGVTLTGPFWSEPVRVLTVRELGDGQVREAVYHYIPRNPRLRFLLADDPGAGKTIMAGPLLKELKYRGLITRTLIVVPGHLKDQWQREIKEKFGETFPINGGRLMMVKPGRYTGKRAWSIDDHARFFMLFIL